MVLKVDNLEVTFDTPDGPVEAVRGVSLHVDRGETVAVVGESGSGKSQIMMATMGLLASNGAARGSVTFKGDEILNAPPERMNRIRGKAVTMIFQEPMTSLDPLYTIEAQLMEPLRVHAGLSKDKARARALELLKLVKIPEPERRLKAYPYEMSGGQRQRVMIAMALANDPDMLIADEPTTALDVTIQAEILALLAELQARLGMAILFITHDLTIVEAFADRVYVMKSGLLEETGPTRQIFTTPKTPYTRMLLDAEPEGTKAPVPDSAPVLLEGSHIDVNFQIGGGLFSPKTHFRAVKDVSIALHEGQTIGVVGESGSGKSTLGRALLRLLPASGRVAYVGKDISDRGRAEMTPLRKGLQLVFQDPYGSLSPRMTVGEIVTEGLLVHEPGLSRQDRARRAGEALEAVGLGAGLRNRFPHEFSGGQRQRIAIARAMVLRPKVVVLDEPTSALDRSVQKQVITLLRDLQTEFGLSYVFISHDLAVVQAMSDFVMVMRDGEVVEQGSTRAIFDAPRTAYTQELMRAAFHLDDILVRSSPKAAHGR
ncbi:MAG: ABC transporter ATP-binding protein [Pseudomonadota bacterium]